MIGRCQQRKLTSPTIPAAGIQLPLSKKSTVHAIEIFSHCYAVTQTILRKNTKLLYNNDVSYFLLYVDYSYIDIRRRLECER